MAGLLPPLSAHVLTLLAEIARPRDPAEWKQRFAHWQRPASQTEEEKIESIARRIKAALDKNEWLSQRKFRVIPQGSYHNNTNVRNDSDVDVCVCLEDAYFTSTLSGAPIPMETLNHVPMDFLFANFRAFIAEVLRGSFDPKTVQPGNKAIKLVGVGDGKITADVVPAYTYLLYSEQNSWPFGVPQLVAKGVGFLAHLNERLLLETLYPTSRTMEEVNGIKYLFGSHQPWNVGQASGFVRAASEYVGY